MTSPDIRAAAERLMTAARERVACAPVRDLIGTDDVVSAYAVQSLVNSAREAAGATVTGRKIGLTAPAVQAQLGVDRPDFGVLFADMDCTGGGGDTSVIALGQLLQPRVEAEIAFVLAEDLADGPLDDAQVRSAVAVARPALEIVDSRIKGWDITFADTVADNGSAGMYVLGDSARSLEEFAPVDAQMQLRQGEEVLSAGTGADCLGDPLLALAWLARTARDVGDPLLAGQVVLSGALGPVVTVSEPGRYTADITGLGPVSVTFTAQESP